MNMTDTRLNVITLDFCDELAEDEDEEELPRHPNQ
jgi:hypothetical protein